MIQPLRYYLHDGLCALRMELTGSQSGEDVNKAYKDWRMGLPQWEAARISRYFAEALHAKGGRAAAA